MLTRIYHKKNELFEVEFYKDKECTEAFDFTNAKNLYLELQNGDVSPFLEIYKYTEWCKCFIPYIPNIEGLDFLPTFENIFTLDDITVNLSKYIPENNAVLFLSENDKKRYEDWFPNQHIGLYIDDGKNDEEFRANNIESLISGIADVKKGNKAIFLTNGTEAELQKANKVAKELKKIYGVKEVNLFVLHCFVKIDCNRIGIEEWTSYDISDDETYDLEYINKIITTNSTGFRIKKNKILQVLDCYDIFNDYLKGE